MALNQKSSREEYLNNPARFETEMGLWIFKSGLHPFFSDKVGPRSVEFYSIHFVASGKVRFGWDGHNVTLSEGDLFCLFPGSIYTYVKDCDQPSTTLMWTAFMGEQMPAVLERIDLIPQRPYRHGAFGDASLDIIREIQGLLMKPQHDHSLQLMSLGFQLIHSIDPNRQRIHAPSAPAASSDWLEAFPVTCSFTARTTCPWRILRHGRACTEVISPAHSPKGTAFPLPATCSNWLWRKRPAC